MPVRLCQNSPMPSVQVRRLSEQDLTAVVALERATYPPELQEAKSLIRIRLRHEDQWHSSLNLGLCSDGRLVGYLLAHLDDGTDCHELALGRNIYLADLAIDPRYRRHLIRLLGAFAQTVLRDYPGLPVAAHSIGGTAEIWQRHEAVMRRLGAGTITRIDNVDVGGGRLRSLMVWRPAASAADTRGVTADAVPPPEATHRTGSGKLLGTAVVTDSEAFTALGGAWRWIEAALPDLTIFQTHAYLAEWIRCFGLPRLPMIVCVFDGAELIGVAPFQVTRTKMHRRFYWQLSFLGSPWEVDRPGFLFTRDAADCAEAVARALLARRDAWDLIWFHEQTAGDPALESFCDVLVGRGLLHGRTASSSCPYLRFDGSWQDLLASKSRRFRRNLRAAHRKLEAAGRVEYESCAGDEARLSALLDEYAQLERRSWKPEAGLGISKSVEHLRFYQNLAGVFGHGGQFVFRCLRLDGRMIAATFGLLHRRSYYSLHIAHDEAYAGHSPGTLLESLELEECFGAGLDEYDFLGGFLKNKLRWATHMRETVAVHLYQRQPWLLLAYVLYFVIKRPLKRWLTKLVGDRPIFVKNQETRGVE